MKYRKSYDKYFTLHFSQGGLEGSLAAYDNAQRWWKQDYIRKWLPEDKFAQILEIGCGLGYHLYALRNLGYVNLRGIDISPDMIEIAECNVSEVDFLNADAFEFLQQHKEKYDLIIMFNILEHFTRDEAIEVTKLSFDSLKNNGLILIRTPNAANPLSFHSLYIDITHEMCYTENSIRDLLGLAGFSKVDIVGIKTYNAIDKLPKKIVKEILFRPMSWMSLNLIRLLYLSQGKFIKVVHPDILAIGIK